MDFSGLSTQLNKQAKSLFLSEKIHFLSTLGVENLANFIAKKVPFSKVAVFFTENSFSVLGVALFTWLKKVNLKPISIILERKPRFSVDQAKGLFNISEDVRYLIVTDSSLSELGSYFATVRNITALFMVDSYDIKGVMAQTLLIDNGVNTEKFTLSATRVLVFDEQRLNACNISNAIAVIGAKICALIDYKIHCTLTGKPQNHKLIALTEDAIDGMLGTKQVKENENRLKISYFAFSVQLLRLVDEDFFTNSCAVITSLLAENVTQESALGEFFSARKVIERYVNAFCFNSGEKRVVNYNLIAEKLSKKLKMPFLAICQDVLYKINLLSNCSGVKILCAQIKNTILRAKKEIDSAYKTFKAHSGKKTYLTKSISENVELSGYVGKGLNGMALLSELGL